MNNPYVQCPYDKQHFVLRSRLQAHVVKCEKKYPPLEICPFNATHRLPKSEIQEHVKLCPSGLEMFAKDRVVTKPVYEHKPMKILHNAFNSNHEDEMWD